MLFGLTYERGSHFPVDADKTGFRAIRSESLEPLFELEKTERGRQWLKCFPREFGMDLALNRLIFGRSRFESFFRRSSVSLNHEAAGRHSTMLEQEM
jgi:hypothetical protein